MIVDPPAAAECMLLRVLVRSLPLLLAVVLLLADEGARERREEAVSVEGGGVVKGVSQNM